MSGEGSTQALRSQPNPMYFGNADPGLNAPGVARHDTSATLEQYENIFGPAARDIKVDNQRNKRHQRWHLPDALKGSNQYLTDRVDGLITDATNSPFTRNILPYVYLENPDQKLKWNVYSFDEGMASRVPYEAAARVLPQSKRSFAGYVVRQGLAIAMEHNFMVSEAGRLNFKRQLMQLVGSIQLTNDLDVHVALVTAPSYQKHMDEKYMDSTRTFAQSCREYADLFGMMQKTTNALDFLIEDAKSHLTTWGSQPPTFLLCNGALTAQLTMVPEKTNYLTNGPDGARRLAQGPDLASYRGLSIINSRKFAMEAGTMPRDILRRRVRVCQHYYIPWEESNVNALFEFYDEGKDCFITKTWDQLVDDSLVECNWNDDKNPFGKLLEKKDISGLVVKLQDGTMVKVTDDGDIIKILTHIKSHITNSADWKTKLTLPNDNFTMPSLTNVDGARIYLPIDLFVLRPNIEHEMLGVIIGRGGTQELGATFWGQTELSCYDDAQHGIWGMSYKYHERAIVTNERNLIRLYDVSFDGYTGGMDDSTLNWFDPDTVGKLCTDTQDVTKPFSGTSMIVMMCQPRNRQLANPLLLNEQDNFPDRGTLVCCDIQKHSVNADVSLKNMLTHYLNSKHPDLGYALQTHKRDTQSGFKAVGNETECFMTSYHGYLAKYVVQKEGGRTLVSKQNGTGHLGQCFEGVASIRMGRGMQMPKGPVGLHHLV